MIIGQLVDNQWIISGQLVDKQRPLIYKIYLILFSEYLSNQYINPHVFIQFSYSQCSFYNNKIQYQIKLIIQIDNIFQYSQNQKQSKLIVFKAKLKIVQHVYNVPFQRHFSNNLEP
ncbi:hypothetical protein pb186bvf_020678 [Paramecium bursaria]